MYIKMKSIDYRETEILYMHVASVTTPQLHVMHAIIAVLIMHSMEPMNWSLLPHTCIAVFITVVHLKYFCVHVYLKMFGIGLTNLPMLCSHLTFYWCYTITIRAVQMHMIRIDNGIVSQMVLSVSTTNLYLSTCITTTPHWVNASNLTLSFFILDQSSHSN